MSDGAHVQREEGPTTDVTAVDFPAGWAGEGPTRKLEVQSYRISRNPGFDSACARRTCRNHARKLGFCLIHDVKYRAAGKFSRDPNVIATYLDTIKRRMLRGYLIAQRIHGSSALLRNPWSASPRSRSKCGGNSSGFTLARRCRTRPDRRASSRRLQEVGGALRVLNGTCSATDVMAFFSLIRRFG